MVNLNAYENYWNELRAKVPAVKRIDFVTEEGDIKDFISDITRSEQPHLLIIIPSSKNVGIPDAVLENNLNLVYLLANEDSFEKNTYQLQKELQPVMESIKNQLIADMENCGLMRRLDISSMQTDPERRIFSKSTGWSLSFEFETE